MVSVLVSHNGKGLRLKNGCTTEDFVKRKITFVFCPEVKTKMYKSLYIPFWLYSKLWQQEDRNYPSNLLPRLWISLWDHKSLCIYYCGESWLCVVTRCCCVETVHPSLRIPNNIYSVFSSCTGWNLFAVLKVFSSYATSTVHYITNQAQKPYHTPRDRVAVRHGLHLAVKLGSNFP